MSGIQPVTGRELAAILHVTPPAITQFAKNGMPRRDDKRYDVVDAVGWYLARLRSTDDVHKQLKAAMRDKYKVDTAIKLHDLVPAPLLEETLKLVFGELKDFLQALPGNVSDGVVSVEKRIDERCRNQLEWIHERLSNAERVNAIVDSAQAVAHGEPDRLGSETHKVRGKRTKTRAVRSEPDPVPGSTVEMF